MPGMLASYVIILFYSSVTSKKDSLQNCFLLQFGDKHAFL